MRPVIFLLILSVGITAALWAHRRFFSPESNMTKISRSYRPEVLLPPPATAPAELIGDPLRQVGLGPVTDNPAGIEPPYGSRGGLERQVREGPWLRIDARYDCPGTVEEIRRYYLDQAALKGFSPVSQAQDDTGWERVLFSMRQMTLIVALRKRDDEGKIVKVVVTLISPVE